MLIPVTQDVFPKLIEQIDNLYEKHLKDNSDALTQQSLTPLAGLLLIYNFSWDTIVANGGYTKSRDRFARWLSSGRTKASVSLGRTKYRFITPVTINGAKIDDTTQAFETGGILGFLAACLRIDLRYVNKATLPSALAEYYGAAGLARDKFCLPLLVRKIRVCKIGQPTRLKTEKAFDLNALKKTPGSAPSNSPSGDLDIPYLASVIFAVAVRRNLMLSLAYKDDASMIRDHLRMAPLGRPTRYTYPEGSPDALKKSLLIPQHMLNPHPRFVRPVAYIRANDDDDKLSYHAVSDPLFLSDPAKLESYRLLKWSSIPTGTAKDVLALSLDADGVKNVDSTRWLELWTPLGSLTARGVDACILQFALNYLRTITGVTTAMSYTLDRKAAWMRSYRIVPSFARFATDAVLSHGFWSDEKGIQGLFLGTTKDSASTPVTATVLVYAKALSEEYRTSVLAIDNTQIQLSYEAPDGTIPVTAQLSFKCEERQSDSVMQLNEPVIFVKAQWTITNNQQQGGRG